MPITLASRKRRKDGLSCDSPQRWVARFLVMLGAALVTLLLLSWPRTAAAPPIVYDYGDAPAPYPSSLADDGARHQWHFNGDVPFFWDLDSVGGRPDYEADAIALFPGAIGDDLTEDRDEKPTQFASFDGPFLIGKNVRALGFAFDSPTPDAYVSLWVDWNRDGDWNDRTERVFADLRVGDYSTVPPPGGTYVGTYDAFPTVPLHASPGITYVRARISTMPGLTSIGPAPDGEVEDFFIEVVRDLIHADGFE